MDQYSYVALFFFLFFVVAFVFFSAATAVILYHLRRFRLQKEHHAGMITIFLFGSVIAAYFEFFLLNAVDWQAVQAMVAHRFMTL
ncbi:hypothetical protein HY250_01795 [Candidatus Azambacteria bacterium]|nr:hypothetical protein [Candidatus Azambacteria bacterium]